MKKLLYLIAYLLTASSVTAQIPQFNYAFELDDSGFNATYDIITDKLGNVYATGTCSESMDMDPSGVLKLAGEAGLFVAKYTANGEYCWHKVFPGLSSSVGYGYGYVFGIDVDSLGNSYFGGYFNGQIDFNPDYGDVRTSTVFYPGLDPSCNSSEQNCCLPEDYDCLGEYSDDIFVVSLNTDGDVRWVNTYGGVGRDEIEKVKVDAAGDVIAVGKFETEMDIDGSTYDASSGESTLIIKFENDGNVDFVHQMLTYGGATALATDVLGNYYVGTTFSFTADFDPSPSNFNITSNGQRDNAIVKFNNTGSFVWAKAISGFQDKQILDLEVDKFNDIVAIGFFEATVDFDPSGAVENRNSVGLYDTYVLKLDATGGFKWVKTFQGVNNCFGIALCTNSAGDIFTTGYFKFTVDFNPGTANFPLGAVGEFDIFQVALDKDGIFKWGLSYGTPENEYGTAMAGDPFDRVITAGWLTDGSIDFDPTFATAKILTANGGGAIFVQSLGTPSANCPDNLQINNVTTSQSFFASNFISASGEISGGPTSFKAGNFIVLNPGFKTSNSVVFNADIGGCPQ